MKLAYRVLLLHCKTALTYFGNHVRLQYFLTSVWIMVHRSYFTGNDL